MNLFRKAAVSTLIAGSTLAGAAVGLNAFSGAAGAQSTSDSSSTTAPGSDSTDATTSAPDGALDPTGRPPRGADGQGPRASSTETALTGDDATKATEAALAAVPGGTVERVETDDDGVYEAHVTDADGNHVIVKLDANFAVTGTETAPTRERNGERGGRGEPGAGSVDPSKGGHTANGITETVLTGDEATKATAAAEAAVAGGSVQRAETDAEGAAFEVHMTDSNGKPVTVKLDASFNVTSVENGMK